MLRSRRAGAFPRSDSPRLGGFVISNLDPWFLVRCEKQFYFHARRQPPMACCSRGPNQSNYTQGQKMSTVPRPPTVAEPPCESHDDDGSSRGLPRRGLGLKFASLFLVRRSDMEWISRAWGVLASSLQSAWGRKIFTCTVCCVPDTARCDMHECVAHAACAGRTANTATGDSDGNGDGDDSTVAPRPQPPLARARHPQAVGITYYTYL